MAKQVENLFYRPCWTLSQCLLSQYWGGVLARGRYMAQVLKVLSLLKACTRCKVQKTHRRMRWGWWGVAGWLQKTSQTHARFYTSLNVVLNLIEFWRHAPLQIKIIAAMEQPFPVAASAVKRVCCWQRKTFPKTQVVDRLGRFASQSLCCMVQRPSDSDWSIVHPFLGIARIRRSTVFDLSLAKFLNMFWHETRLETLF